MPLPAAAAAAPAPPAAVPSATPFAPPPAAASSSGAPMAGFEAFEGGTAIVEPKHRRYAPAPKRRKAGLVIVVIAVLLAVAIVGVGFLIAGQRRADAARARELDRMLEALRDSQRTPTAVDPLPPG
ncbi:MAG: hypothetical protein KF729_19725, partial [Sandaracinaceae bacterium]|nr:hypothetical protein [Sandaracinaceae bacterium]